MRTLRQLRKRVKDYRKLHIIYVKNRGLLVWRVSTGDNIEFIFIESATKGKGYGRRMFRAFKRDMRHKGVRPFHSIFGFTYGKNGNAIGFYRHLGFSIKNLGRSIYGLDNTVLVWMTYKDFLKKI